jgi:hypothetical protein
LTRGWNIGAHPGRSIVPERNRFTQTGDATIKIKSIFQKERIKKTERRMEIIRNNPINQPRRGDTYAKSALPRFRNYFFCWRIRLQNKKRLVFGRYAGYFPMQ